MSTTCEIAERIICSGGGRATFDFDKAIDAIDKALQAERERAAKIAESHGDHASHHGCASRIAQAIREGKAV